MAFITKQQVFEQIIADDKPVCPHCGETMKLWEVPDIPVEDGLGWGSPYLYLCFNDECPLYVSGWRNMEANYGRTCSYRCICYPDSRKCEIMSVFGPLGGTGQIVDEAAVEHQHELERRIVAGFAVLDEAETGGDGATSLRLLLDAAEPIRVRVRAAELIGVIGGIDAIDPLRDHVFDNDILQKKVADAIGGIHERCFTRECPFCAEIIKRRAKICKHCGKEVAGL